jgi:RNA exonuclease 1
MERLWQFHHTPPQTGDGSEIRAAVAIDCEMGSAMSGDSELIRISLIDYFSGSVLIDTLVYPDVPMEHFPTKYSGVTRKDMETARRQKTCLMGLNLARQAAWRYVGPHTIVVGHSANNDLTSMRWIHPGVVDTFIIEFDIERERQGREKKEKEEREKEAEGQKPGTEKEERNPPPQNAKPAEASTDSQPKKEKKPKGSGACSLKTLARTRLNQDIQNAGKQGHDSLEDALAARDLAHWHVCQRIL